MYLVYSNVFLFQIVSIILSLFMIIFTIKKARRSSLSNTVIVGFFLSLVWIITQIIDINARTYDLMWAAVRIKFIPLCFIGFYWLVFSCQYAGYRIKDHRIYFFLLIIPSFTFYISLITNPYHYLFYRIFDLKGKYGGIFFYLTLIITYLYLFVGLIIIIKATISNKNISKKVTFLLICSAIVPFIPNLLFAIGVIDPGFDIAPSSFSLSAILYFIAI